MSEILNPLSPATAGQIPNLQESWDNKCLLFEDAILGGNVIQK